MLWVRVKWLVVTEKRKNRIKYKWIQKNCRRFEGKELYVCGQAGQD